MNINLVRNLKNLLGGSNRSNTYNAEKYLASVSLFNLSLSYDSFGKIAEHIGINTARLTSELNPDYFSSGENRIGVKSGIHEDTIFSEYFSRDPKAAEEKIAELFNMNLLSENDMLLFTKKIIGYLKLREKPVLSNGISRIRILKAVKNSTFLKDVLANHNKLYRLEIPIIYAEFFCEDAVRPKEDLIEAIDRSYIYTRSALNSRTSGNNKIKLWHKYAFVCSDMGLENLPAGMLEIDSIYKGVTDFFKYRLSEDTGHPLFTDYAIQVAKKVISDINCRDIPSVLLISKAYQLKGDFEAAELYLNSISDNIKGMTAILDMYEQKVRWLLVNSPYSDDIKALNDKLESKYKTFLSNIEMKIQNSDNPSKTNKLRENYLILMTNFSRFERSRNNYQNCFYILEDALSEFSDFKEAYRIYNELGLLYQKPGKSNYPNPYFSTEKAIEALKKADELAAAYANDQNQRKYMLMPLANTYFSCGRYREALEVCNTVLSIDFKENRAKKLIDRILVNTAA